MSTDFIQPNERGNEGLPLPTISLQEAMNELEQQQKASGKGFTLVVPPNLLEDAKRICGERQPSLTEKQILKELGLWRESEPDTQTTV